MGKVTLGLGLGVGYVLGARAGKERYRQIVQATQGLLGRPEVQQTLEKARDAAPAPLQSSIDKLTQAGSGGSSGSGGSPGSGGSSGSGGSGGIATPTVSTGTVDVDPALPGDVGLAATPPPPVGGAGDPGLTGAGVPDPLVPPAKSDGPSTGRP
ncbi:hypothetical protein [Geodermatophilus sp. SYSU D00766]